MTLQLSTMRVLWWRELTERRVLAEGAPAVVVPLLAALALPGSAVPLWPGLVLAAVMWTAAVAARTTVSDPFLAVVLAGPASRLAVFAAKSLAACTQALVVGALVLAIGGGLAPAEPLALVSALVITALATSAVGVAAAWSARRASVYRWQIGALVPLWLVSGALDAGLLERSFAFRLNPVAIAHRALHDAMLGARFGEAGGLLLAVGVLTVTIAMFIAVRRSPS